MTIVNDHETLAQNITFEYRSILFALHLIIARLLKDKDNIRFVSHSNTLWMKETHIMLPFHKI